MARVNSLICLHPWMRYKVDCLIDSLNKLGIPLVPYETVRTPFRQSELYLRGRMGRSGGTVTHAKAWTSKHQYGLAADFVFHVDGKWNWKEPGPGMWKAYHDEAAKLGLRTLGFEKPHVELECELNDLRAGRLPEFDHDDAGLFLEWYETQIETWGADQRSVGGIMHPGAPPFLYDERPALEDYA